LLPPDMRDWLPEDDIVHLILDAVALMDLAAFEATHKLGGAGQAPFVNTDRNFLGSAGRKFLSWRDSYGAD
jgi:hypothetical protein